MLFLAKSWACSAEIRRFNTFADVVRNTGEPVRLTLSIQRKPLFAMDFEGTYVTVAAIICAKRLRRHQNQYRQIELRLGSIDRFSKKCACFRWAQPQRHLQYMSIITITSCSIRLCCRVALVVVSSTGICQPAHARRNVAGSKIAY